MLKKSNNGILKAYDDSEIKGKKSFARAAKSLHVRKATFMKQYHTIKGTEPKKVFEDGKKFAFRTRISIEDYEKQRVKKRGNWKYQIVLKGVTFEKDEEVLVSPEGFSSLQSEINERKMIDEAIISAMMKLGAGSGWNFISFEHIEIEQYKWRKPISRKAWFKLQEANRIKTSKIPKKDSDAYEFTKRDSRHHPNLGFDVENNPKTGKFICAGFAGEVIRHTRKGNKHVYIEKFFDNEPDMVHFAQHEIQAKNITSQSCNLIVFNGGYDMPFLKSICEPFLMDSKFITTRLVLPNDGEGYKCGGVAKRGVPVIDLTNHVRGTLEYWINTLDMSKNFEIEKGKLDIGAPYKGNEEMYKTRVMNDARATYRLANHIEDFWHGLPYESSGLHGKFKLTAPSSAIHCWNKVTSDQNKPTAFISRNKYQKIEWEKHKEAIDFIERKAYYGGHTECFTRGTHMIQSFDVVSMYPYHMENEYYPDSTSIKDVRYNVLPDWSAPFGIFHVDIHIPKMKIPPLPYKDKKDAITLYPTGDISGYWTKYELEYAVSLGCRITKEYDDSINYYKGIHCFSEYVRFLFKLKAQYKKDKNKGMLALVKVALNSVYGKFGQHNVVGASGVYDIYSFSVLDFDELEGKTVMVTTDSITGEDMYLVSGGEKTEMTNNTVTAIAAYVTAYARIGLHKQMMKVERDGYEVAYCDTDSIHAVIPQDEIINTYDNKPYDIKPKHVMKSSGVLGAFEFEYKRYQTYYREKYYEYHSGLKCKGVPARHETITDNNEVLEISFNKPNKYKESIRRGLTINQWNDHVKLILKSPSKKRVWKGNKSTPVHIEA